MVPSFNETNKQFNETFGRKKKTVEMITDRKKSFDCILLIFIYHLKTKALFQCGSNFDCSENNKHTHA